MLCYAMLWLPYAACHDTKTGTVAVVYQQWRLVLPMVASQVADKVIIS